MKKATTVACELCDSPAKTYCESDRARLCWRCDAKVHGANFLVAKHSRTLLCHLCQGPTPWSASGPILAPASMSVCLSCLSRSSNNVLHSPQTEESDHHHREQAVSDETGSSDELHSSSDYDEDEDDEYRSYSEDDDEEEDDENQVVPWTSTPPPQQQPSDTAVAANGSEETEDLLPSLKRKREISYGLQHPLF